MDRYATFVDVGYLYAGGGLLCLDTKNRSQMQVDVPGFVAMLKSVAATACGMPLLRTYWYDGAKDGVPTAEQQRAGRVDDVKVRLGRINSNGQQKGVDALIYRDLMTLARERSISHAFLFGGDGDLVEGVRAAQDMGTHVTLVHLTSSRNQGTSPDLLHEVDRRIELSRDDLAPYFETPSDASQRPLDVAVPVAEAAAAHASQWLARAAEADVSSLLAQYPKIPVPLDVELLQAVEALRGGVSLRGDQAARRSMRQSFWAVVRDRAVASSDEPN